MRVEGPVDPETGFVVDYADLKRLVDCEIIERLDHTHLGQYVWRPDCPPNCIRPDFLIPQCAFGYEFYPSSENLTVAIGKMLQPLIKELKHGVSLYEVSLDETCTSRCTWRPTTD